MSLEKVVRVSARAAYENSEKGEKARAANENSEEGQAARAAYEESEAVSKRL
jgi:hypothetical protein